MLGGSALQQGCSSLSEKRLQHYASSRRLYSDQHQLWRDTAPTTNGRDGAPPRRGRKTNFAPQGFPAAVVVPGSSLVRTTVPPGSSGAQPAAAVDVGEGSTIQRCTHCCQGKRVMFWIGSSGCVLSARQWSRTIPQQRGACYLARLKNSYGIVASSRPHSDLRPPPKVEESSPPQTAAKEHPQKGRQTFPPLSPSLSFSVPIHPAISLCFALLCYTRVAGLPPPAQGPPVSLRSRVLFCETCLALVP